MIELFLFLYLFNIIGIVVIFIGSMLIFYSNIVVSSYYYFYDYSIYITSTGYIVLLNSSNIFKNYHKFSFTIS